MSLKRQNYSWWRFFDKAGDNANFTYDEDADKWTGTIYIDKVSTGLIEYEPLYVLEQIFDNSAVPGTSQLGLRQPRKANLTSFCPGATQSNILAKWYDETPGLIVDNVPELFLWTIEGYPGPTPIVVKHESLDIDLGDQTNDILNPAGGTGGTGQPGQVLSAPFINEALSIRVGLESKEEGSYVRTLQLIDPDYLYEDPIDTFPGCTSSAHVFAEITFYGETEAEDVRLDTMLDNLGDVITNSDFKIFDDVDINESLPDFIKLNVKRKELLLEWDNIFPFTGAYKALINVLKYFGYDQVTLKEYWLNVREYQGENPEKISRIRYKQIPIQDLFSTEPKTMGGDSNLYPNKLYTKTSKFGLFYDITRDSGKFDNDGLPIVEEAFLFSNEEVLIKLYALKQKLKEYFLPLNARIVDIIGEAVYYARYDLNVWQDFLRVDDIELNINPCVHIEPEHCCSQITDLTPDNFIGIKIPPDLNMAGVSDFVTYAVGVTQYSTSGGPAISALSGSGDTYFISDTISGASFAFSPPPGQTNGQVINGIISEWESQLTEPWTQFNLVPEVGQNYTNILTSSQLNGYAWFYAVQDDIIGPTSGMDFVIGVTANPGPTSFTYTSVGSTFTGNLSPFIGASAMSNYSNAFIGYFDGFDRSVDDLNDYPCAPIAAPFVLSNCSFDIDWDQMVIPWNTLDFGYLSLPYGAGVTGGAGASETSNYSFFDYTYTFPSYPIGYTSSYTGYTGITSSGPPGGTYFYPYGNYTSGSTPGTPYHPPGPTYVSGFASATGPTHNPVLYDWINVGYENFYEMEWIITYDEDPSYIVESGRLSIEDGKSFPILLKYIGTYSIELILYDSWGGTSKWIQNSAICVETKDVDFIGHYKFRECEYDWDNKTIKRQSDQVPAPKKPDYPIWEMYNSIWDLPLQENEQFSMEDLTYNDLDKIEFYQTQNDPQFQGWCSDVSTLPPNPGITGSSGLYDLDAYKWNLIENESKWEDVCHLWWDGIGPSITQTRIEYPTALASSVVLDTPTFAFFKEPFIGDPDNVGLAEDISAILAIPGPTYGSIYKDMDPTAPTAQGETNVYQYLGGAPGITGGTSWLMVDVNIETFTMDTILYPGIASVNEAWKEMVRQFNVELEDNGDSYEYMNDFLIYYQERYDDPLNPLYPYLQFVTKEYSTNSRYYIRAFQNLGLGPGFLYFDFPLINASGATANYVSTYETVNFGDMGDIPVYLEIFAVGACGGEIWLPGPTTYIDGSGDQVTGPTYWDYITGSSFSTGSTGLEELWQELTYRSEGLIWSGPSAGAGPTYVSGPILDYGWNVVYGASGFTGPTGASFGPPSGSLVPIKIQGSKNYFTSYDYQCAKFVGGSTGVLGGTAGIAGTMCGRAITSNSSWNNLRIHKYANEFPMLTQIQFNYSLSPMNGKVKPQWKLIKENDENWENIYYNNPYFSYLFNQRGVYTLELTITDNNGNEKTKTKKEFVKIT